MRIRIVLMLALSGIAGLCCLAIMRSISRGPAEPQDDRRVILVAKSTLESAVALTEDMLQEVRRRPEDLPEGYFKDAKELVGRVLCSRVPANTVITEVFLAPKGALAGLEGKIPPGYCAKTIKVDEWSGVGGFVVPGSRVNVLTTIKDRKTKRSKAKTILRNVEVIAVGQNLTSQQAPTGNKEADGQKHAMLKRSVTFLLTGKEAEVLTGYEADGGKITLSLRSGSDESSDDDYVLDEDLFSTPEAKAAVVVSPAEKTPNAKRKPLERFVTWVYLGDSIQQVTYVKVNGMWLRETANGLYQASEPAEVAALPKVKTTEPAQAAPEDSPVDEEDQEEPADSAEQLKSSENEVQEDPGNTGTEPGAAEEEEE